jgi:DNA-binding winged helix-turn-helix (wHTH) protein/tetratricopeptide (TPR) repeat protein
MASVRFGVFDFDVDSRELRRQGRRVHLTGQAAMVLTILVKRRGQVVTRDELKRALWSDATFVDFDRSLNFCVSSLRAALQDAAKSPRFVETLPKRGYRFIGDVAAIESTDAAPAPVPVVRRVALVDHRVAAAALVLTLAIQHPAHPIAHSRSTATPAARAAFDRAIDASERGDTERRRSIAALRAAVRTDPRFAEAHYALADLYLDLALKRELPMMPALVEAEDAARKALALEDAPETHQVLGIARLHAAWDWTAAKTELARAVALAPKWDMGLAAYARVLSAAGSDEEAIDVISRAEAISPTCDLILFDAGTIYARARHFAMAEDKFRRALEFGPPRSMLRSDWTVDVQLRILRMSVIRGERLAARAAAEAILAANGEPEDVRRRFALQDPRLAVERFLRRSVEMMTANARTGSPTRIATLYALLEEPDSAVEWLEKAARDGDPDLVYALRDPDFDKLRGRPRFEALRARGRSSAAPLDLVPAR